MSVTLTGGTGLFDVIGRLGGWIRDLNGIRGAGSPAPTSSWASGGPVIADAGTAFANIVAAVPTGNKKDIDGIFAKLQSFRDTTGGTLKDLQTFAKAYLISVVNADTPLASQAIVPALQVLISQMKSASESVRPNTVTATVTVGSANVGTAKVIASVLGTDGYTREYCFNETLTLTANKDQNTGATAGSEVLTLTAPAAVSDKLSYLWPAGSGSTGSVTVINPALDQGTKNVLYNSDFDSFTSNVPDHWTIVTGTAGTSVLKSVSVTHSSWSTASLQIVGDGAELTSITQQFNSSTGSTVVVKPSTAYPIGGWCKVSAAPSTGVMKLELVDGSNTVINDDFGTANAVTVTLTAQTTSWAFFSGWFRTPTNLPSTVKLRIRLTTALESGKSAYVDDLAMGGNALQVYTGGPLLAAFRGDTEVVKNDTYSVAVANTMSAFYGAQQTGKWQTLFEILFDMRANGLILPSSSSNTINEGLIAAL